MDELMIELGVAPGPLLVLLDSEIGDDGGLYGFRARIISSQMRAESDICEPVGSSLAVFFSSLSASWDGWEGEQLFVSHERDFSLAATIDRTGHVSLRVSIAEGAHPDAWKVEATVNIEAGQLAAIAARIQRFATGGA